MRSRVLENSVQKKNGYTKTAGSALRAHGNAKYCVSCLPSSEREWVLCSPVFLSRYGGDEGALAAAHVADHADQLAGPHVAAAVLQHDALRRVAVLAVVHVGRRQRSVIGTA